MQTHFLLCGEGAVTSCAADIAWMFFKIVLTACKDVYAGSILTPASNPLRESSS